MAHTDPHAYWLLARVLSLFDPQPGDDQLAYEGLLWRPVRRRLGITAFGTNAYTAEKGTERVVEEHSEEGGHEELYFVVSGHAGPGVRDAVDYVTDVVGRGRYHCVVAKDCDMKCNSKMKFEWWVSDEQRTAAIKLRPGFVPVEFYTLSDRLGTPETTKDDIKAFSIFKVNLSARIWNAPLEESFRVEVVEQRLQPGDLPVEIDETYFDYVPT